MLVYPVLLSLVLRRQDRALFPMLMVASGIRVASGERVKSPGTVTMDFIVKLMLDAGESSCELVHWDRRIRLEGVWVLPEAGDPSPTYLPLVTATGEFMRGLVNRLL